MNKRFFVALFCILFTVSNAQIVNIPDVNFKNKLLQASPTNLIASTSEPDDAGNVSPYGVIDINGDAEIQVSEASLIKCLKIDNSEITNLQGISAFTNLKYLDCSNNQITNLDLSGLTVLRNLKCFNNQLTNLNVIGLNFLKSFDCRNNQLTTLNCSNLPSLSHLYCSDNQLINLDLSSTYLYNLYCNNNQLTTLSLNSVITLQVLYCQNNQLQSLDVSNTNMFILVCSNNLLTSLFIKNGNNTWYGLEFQNNPNLAFVCADEDDLTLVQNKINSYGYTTTCHTNSYCNFTPGGDFYVIQGNHKLDTNANGCDASDSTYPNLKYSITNGSISGNLISNISGNYSIPVQQGTHTITPQFENPTYFTATPASATVSFPSTASPFTQNFCIAPNGVHHDLEVVLIPVDVARPGFDATYKIKYKDKGNQTENTIINFNYNDAILDYVSSSVAATSQATGNFSWNIGTIAPFASGEIMVTLNVNSPMETPAVNGGDVLIYTATANGLNTDETPDDNTFTLQQTVVNSFDPNDKTCLEGTTISPSNIGQYVHYQIRFENTGTFPAQNIVVKDLIDTTMFDVSTLQMTNASHSCVTRITNPNQVEFIFENINLPFDDANNDGYIVFKIKTKSTLVAGNTISNSANIYFDYNFPIVTNTATSTFQVLQNDTFEFDNYFTIYPNPVKDILNLISKQDTEVNSLTIYNLLGQQLLTVINPKEKVDVSNLKVGSYIVKVTTNKGVFSSNFIKK